MEQKKLRSILIIDDDKDILTVAKLALNIVPDLTVSVASSGEVAIKKAIEVNPDLILLDIMMPNMDGKSTLKALRLIPNLVHTPIVFFTARVQPIEIEEYLQLGVIDVVIKPFDAVSFPKTIENIWNKYQASVQAQ